MAVHLLINQTMAPLLVVIGLVLAQTESVRFLPDDSEVACRAILPQCFRRADWAKLCASQPEIRVSFADACSKAEDH